MGRCTDKDEDLVPSNLSRIRSCQQWDFIFVSDDVFKTIAGIYQRSADIRERLQVQNTLEVIAFVIMKKIKKKVDKMQTYRLLKLAVWYEVTGKGI
jgi:hypothetical protein